MRVLAAALPFVIACAAQKPAARTVAAPIPPPTQSMAELRAGLASADPETRAGAAWALAGAATVPADVDAALVKALHQDPEAQVRLGAAWALGHVKVEGAERPADAQYDEPPKLIRQTRPVYPTDAYLQKIQGSVDVQLLIDEQGKVARAEVRKSVPGLDAAAVQTVLQWAFRPARKAGRPVPTTAVAPVTFKILN
jgi:TonB family protein